MAVIVVNTVPGSSRGRDARSAFFAQALPRVIEQHPDVRFVILAAAESPVYSRFTNVLIEESLPPGAGVIRWQWWLQVTLPALLRKHRASVFLGCDAIGLRRVTAVQVLYVDDLQPPQAVSALPAREAPFRGRIFRKSVLRASSVLVPSEFCRDRLSETAGVPPGKIAVILPGTDTRKAAEPAEREHIKTQYAGSREYFAWRGGVDGRPALLNVLRAFSAFKKRQKSQMRLLLIGDKGPQYEAFREKLERFRFREDVQVITGASRETEEQIMSASYAAVIFADASCLAESCLEAMAQSVPLITSKTGAAPEICGDGALYADPGDFQSIALQMLLLFKDEARRRVLIDQGLRRSGQFRWDDCAARLWQHIQPGIC